MPSPMPKTEKNVEDMIPVACDETELRMSADYVDPSCRDTEGADGRAPGSGSLDESNHEASIMESGGLEDGAAEIPESEPCPDAYAGWVDLVERIRTSRTDGMAELYELFSKGIRFY